MKIATYNVENMFDRAKALNTAAWSEGRPALEAHKELNELLNKDTYTNANKTRMLKLFKDHGLLKKDDGPLLILRKIRGKLLNRPRTGAVTVAATGRGDWIGWVELKAEAVREIATENTARVIGAVDPDVLGVVEAEDRTTLRLFNDQVLPAVNANTYDHVMLIDGNDDRGIDVGILTKKNFPIVSIRSHVDDTDSVGKIFSRDCPEYEIGIPTGGTLWVLVNHFKSKGFGGQASNDAKRKRQARRVREIYEAHLSTGRKLVAVIGDLNDTPDRDPLSPLLADGSSLKDVSVHPRHNDGGRPGTHGNSTASSKIDYILLSPDLFSKVTAAGIERRGMWGGTNGTLWPHFPEVASAKDAASDHAALWVDLQL
jgi:endonuclease/exonuclease/phosphatase family metal-dependent hydrolase